jgi:hypothetical protein
MSENSSQDISLIEERRIIEIYKELKVGKLRNLMNVGLFLIMPRGFREFQVYYLFNLMS